MLTALLIDLCILSVFLLLGLQLARWIAPEADRLLYASSAFPLGTGLYTWCLFCLAWVGVPVGTGLMASVAGALLVVVSALRWLASRHRRAVHRQATLQAGAELWALWGGLGILLLAALVLSVGRSYSAYDAAAGWAIKGYGIALEGSLEAGREWGSFGLGYPLNIMLQIATFSLFEGESLPGSKLIFPIYLAAVCLACYRFWRRFGVERLPAVLSTAFLATNPVAFLHATNGYANLPFAANLTLGTLLSLEGMLDGRERIQAIGGLLLGIAAWTRPEGIGYYLALVLGFFLVRALVRNRTVRVLPWLVPGALIALGWNALAWRSVMLSRLGETMQAVPSGLTLGQAHLFELYLIPRLFLERAVALENWGMFLPAVVALLVLGAAQRRVWRRDLMLALAVLTVITAVVPVLIYYARSFEPSVDFAAILRRDFDRAFLPGFFMLCVMVVQAALRKHPSEGAMYNRPTPDTALARTAEASLQGTSRGG